MTGDRGPIMISLLAYSISYIVASKRNISWVAILLCIVLGGYCLTLIGSVRRNANLITLKEIMSNNNTVETKSILPFTEELAGSYNTFTYVVDNIPQKHPYFYGTMQLRNIGYSVPFLHHILPFIYSKIDYENSTTSYCTYLIQGINSTYGNGASLLADIYLDFGVIGIIIIMMLIGYFVSLLDYSLFFGKSIYSLLISVICFSYSIYISRSILVTPIYYILPSIMIIYFKNFFKK